MDDLVNSRYQKIMRDYKSGQELEIAYFSYVHPLCAETCVKTPPLPAQLRSPTRLPPRHRQSHSTEVEVEVCGLELPGPRL